MTIAWAKRPVAEAAAARAEKSTDKDLPLLTAKLERARGRSIDELAKIAETWDQRTTGAPTLRQPCGNQGIGKDKGVSRQSPANPPPFLAPRPGLEPGTR